MRGLFLFCVVLSLVAFLLSGCGGSSTTPAMLTTPTIYTVTPTSVAPSGTIQISGSYFNGTFTTVYFFPTTPGTASGQATASSGDTAVINVTVPSTLGPGPYVIYVQTTNASNNISAASNQVSLSIS